MLFLFSNYNISPLALSRCVLVVTIILLTSLWRIYGVLERG
ncbi:putative membrane protein [Phocaeicola vulgatus str. 3775 SL(B) 10 (iv)]|uniref:Putative membrane protein n=1 Tax=Phocaeicola vulgatus str. 3775 SL(B) 10 (iv) TaxID=1339350 RepID=A0A078R532_PHOVU|nr:putative membrane protein [Phocaeicola vulgatus str. 3775 SR(B) 19]KDS30508.1 putative membrane protein [Phocaeicola vulgatus str. 3775 SL(B) 10 (iv)]